MRFAFKDVFCFNAEIVTLVEIVALVARVSRLWPGVFSANPLPYCRRDKHRRFVRRTGKEATWDRSLL